MRSDDLTWLHDYVTTQWPAMTLDTVQFWINPDSYDDQAEELQYSQNTLAGLIRWDYGSKPRIYTLHGTTGNAALDGPGGMKDLERFVPKPGRTDTLYAWRFPSFWPGVRWVRFNRFHRTATTQYQWYHFYEIELQEDPPEMQQPFIRVADDAALQIPLPYGNFDKLRT